MTTPKELIKKVQQLIKENKLEFIDCKPTIENYGVDIKGEWVILAGKKYYFKER